MKYQLAGIQYLDASQDSMYELADLQVDRHVPVLCQRMIRSHGCFFLSLLVSRSHPNFSCQILRSLRRI